MKNIFSGQKKEIDTLNTYVKLMRASEKVSSETHHHLAEFKLTSSQFAVMEAIYHLGPLSQREIAKKTLKSHGNITTVINNLERRKLVKRLKIKEDKRLFSVELSNAGRKLIADIFPQHVSSIVRRFNVLTPAEQHELARLCRKLGLS